MEQRRAEGRLRNMDGSSFTDEENWCGGHYELVLEVGDRDDAQLDSVLRAIWGDPRLDGCYARRDEAPESQPRTGASVAELLRAEGHLFGRATLPSGVSVVCGTCVTREVNDGPDWAYLYLPLGALSRIDPRVGGYPFAPDDRHSLAWRRPIDDWLRSIGDLVYEAVPFRFGAIGFETSMEVATGQLLDGVPRERRDAYLLPTLDALEYYPATL